MAKTDGSRPHKPVIKSRCTTWCSKPKHNRTPVGNTHRFHDKGSFKKTHHTYYSGNKLKPKIKLRLKLYARKYRAAHKSKGKKK